jgi:hypothetical protein
MIRIINTCSSSRWSNRAFLFPWHTVPKGPEYPYCRGFTITVRHTTLDEWSARRTDLYLTIHNTSKIDIHAAGGIRIRSTSKGAAADSLGRWDRPNNDLEVFLCGLLVHLFDAILALFVDMFSETVPIKTTHTQQTTYWRNISTFYFRTSNVFTIHELWLRVFEGHSRHRLYKLLKYDLWVGFALKWIFYILYNAFILTWSLLFKMHRPNWLKELRF